MSQATRRRNPYEPSDAERLRRGRASALRELPVVDEVADHECVESPQAHPGDDLGVGGDWLGEVVPDASLAAAGVWCPARVAEQTISTVDGVAAGGQEAVHAPEGGPEVEGRIGVSRHSAEVRTVPAGLDGPASASAITPRGRTRFASSGHLASSARRRRWSPARRPRPVLAAGLATRPWRDSVGPS